MHRRSNVGVSLLAMGPEQPLQLSMAEHHSPAIRLIRIGPKKGLIGPFLEIFNLSPQEHRLPIEDLCLKVCPQEQLEATQSGVAAYSNAGSR